MTETTIQYVREQLRNYVEQVTEQSRGSRDKYNCPLCGKWGHKTRWTKPL